MPTAIVSCEARRLGEKVLISFELIDGRNDRRLGGDSIEGEYRDILSLQGKAALAIARKVQAALTPEETRAISRKETSRPGSL